MLFWILIGAAVAITLAVIIYNWWEDGSILWGLASGIFSTLVSAAVIIAVMGFLSLGPTRYVVENRPHEYELKAMSTSDQTSGRTFLTSGYISEQPAFSYIREGDSGGSVLRWANASESTVFESDAAPTVRFSEVTYGNPWLFPWTRTDNQDFVFTVPPGSVANSFEVAP